MVKAVTWEGFASERGVSLDLDRETGREELARLIDWADILIHNYPVVPGGPRSSCNEGDPAWRG